MNNSNLGGRCFLQAQAFTDVAYKHSSVVPRDADVQNNKIFMGK